MRLLNVHTLAFEEFHRAQVPPYAILSHRWRDEEVAFNEIHTPEATTKAGYVKIWRFCEKAAELGFEYGWVDTCCIDKTNSTELSEAINSMFRWYQNSAICLAYLFDVTAEAYQESPSASLAQSKWFTRGFTLQELLAPAQVYFLASDWTPLGDRDSLALLVSNITGINKWYLTQPMEETSATQADLPLESRLSRVQKATFAEKMSWAARRQTEREEDMAYSLLGLCGVNMPLLYGEGPGAFRRLQQEMIRQQCDPSLLAWDLVFDIPDEHPIAKLLHDPSSLWPRPSTFFGWEHPWSHPTHWTARMKGARGVLASHPAAFANSARLIPFDASLDDWELTVKGLALELPTSHDEHPYVVLPFRMSGNPWQLIAVPLIRIGQDLYGRAALPPKLVPYATWFRWQPRRLVLSTKDHEESHIWATQYKSRRGIVWISLPENLELLDVSPREGWAPSSNTIHFPRHGPVERKIKFRTMDTNDTFSICIWLTSGVFPSCLRAATSIGYRVSANDAEFVTDRFAIKTTRKRWLQHPAFYLEIAAPPQRHHNSSGFSAAQIISTVQGRSCEAFAAAKHAAKEVRDGFTGANMETTICLCYNLPVSSMLASFARLLALRPKTAGNDQCYCPESGDQWGQYLPWDWVLYGPKCLACVDPIEAAFSTAACCVSIHLAYRLIPWTAYLIPVASRVIHRLRLLLAILVSIPAILCVMFTSQRTLHMGLSLSLAAYMPSVIFFHWADKLPYVLPYQFLLHIWTYRNHAQYLDPASIGLGMLATVVWLTTQEGLVNVTVTPQHPFSGLLIGMMLYLAYSSGCLPFV
ncbi:hypothetical protein JX265_005712 [Neoarthrinium moseri]|uniref:Heterokaryon incompatibility domain-containing protein n=1 Tax=Neoarthrinium moseri TaxID=1658444 RepID=A0A9Q0AR05_9PEZI|nr:hypothetical protein JX265_005712 [Neoarthrinium moseri]